MTVQRANAKAQEVLQTDDKMATKDVKCVECKKPPSPFLSAFAVVAYIGVSLAMTTISKMTVSVLKFPSINALLFLESVVTVLSLMIADGLNLIQLSPVNRGIITQLPLVTLSKAGNMFFSFLAMRSTSIPVYNVLKRLNCVFAMLMDFLIRGKRVPLLTCLSVVMIGSGVVVTAKGDLDFDAFGYGVAFFAAICQSIYLVLSARACDKIPDLTHVDLLFWTAVFNQAIFLPLAYSEREDFLNYFETTEHPIERVIAGICIFMFVGAILNFVTFMCVAVNSPVTTGVAGNTKGVLSTLVGYIFFSARLETVGWIGVCFSGVGGAGYTYSKLAAKKAAAAKELKKE